MLLRIGKRRTSCELRDASEFCRVEFVTKDGTLDVNLSVYEVQQNEIVRTRVEHCAGVGMDPPRGGWDYDVSDLHSRSPVKCIGYTQFVFTQGAHRELRFVNEDELVQFADRLLKDIQNRKVEITKEEMKSYVNVRLREGDIEWLKFLDSNPKCHRWQKYATITH